MDDWNGKIEYLTEYKGSSIYIRRDDRIPFSYGGNKVLIARELFADMKTKGCDTVISYGSAGSNMNRACAAFAKAHGLKCRVIIKREEPEAREAKDASRIPDAVGITAANNSCTFSNSAEKILQTPEFFGINENERLVRETGAVVTYCTRATVRETVENVIALSKANGERPYYIYGDTTGRGNETVLMRAGYREFSQILCWEKENNVELDNIVLAAGTGMTISGLYAGLVFSGADGTGIDGRKITGISVARDADSLMSTVEENLHIFADSANSDTPSALYITDAYLCGGYGRYTDAIESVIRDMEQKHVYLDPTYTGKAYYGMLREIDAGRIHGNVLFIHTGGYPLYLDWKRKL